VVSANFCSSTFHSRTRDPLEPPPSAVIVQLAGVRVALTPHDAEPATNGSDRELSGIAVDPDTHPSRIGADVVHPVRHDLAEFLVLEVVHLHALRITLRTIIGATVLVIAISSFFLVSTEMTGCPAACAAMAFALMCSNCALRSGCFEPSSAFRFDCRL